jgi:hypothetical protein
MKSGLTVGLALLLGSFCNAAIVYPKAPDGGELIVSKNLDAKLLGISRVEDLTVAEPYRCYFAGASSLASGELLSEAKAGGWQYRLMRGGNAVGAVDLVPNKKDAKALIFAGLYGSNFSKEVLAAARMAEKLPQIKKQDYELRRLDIPGLNFVAVWLHGKSADIIMPLPPTFGRKLNAYQTYSEGEIIRVLEPEAKGVMKAPNLVR